MSECTNLSSAKELSIGMHLKLSRRVASCGFFRVFDDGCSAEWRMGLACYAHASRQNLIGASVVSAWLLD